MFKQSSTRAAEAVAAHESVQRDLTATTTVLRKLSSTSSAGEAVTRTLDAVREAFGW